MKALRLPMAFTRWLMVFSFEPHTFTPFSTSWVCGRPTQVFSPSRGTIRFFVWPLMGSHRFLINPSYTSALLSDPGRTVYILPFRYIQCCPHSCNDEGSNAYRISRLYHTALVPTVYASRTSLPTPMQDSFLADG